MEIGSFIELQFEKGKEFYAGDKYGTMDIVRLNSGRAAIYHSFRCLNCDKLYLPYYQCDTVRNFLIKKKVKIEYYYIDSSFNPKLDAIEENAAILFVNYFGIMSNQRMSNLAGAYHNVIIDNSQAFFAKPIENCMNVYSARKFMGVPDGAYVIGPNAGNFYDECDQDYSSDTAGFLLQRIEYGCEGKTYKERMKNEKRIDESDVLKMSKLTNVILDGTNYDYIIMVRKNNFNYASELFKNVNCYNIDNYRDDNCVPMVYPLVVEDNQLLEMLLKKKHYQGHWWSYLLDEISTHRFEYWLSRYIIPITIDQRYGKKEIQFLYSIIDDLQM